MPKDLVTISITVSRENASYILSLLALWSDDSVDCNTSLQVLPNLIRDIAFEIDGCQDFKNPEIIESLKWDDYDLQTINAIMKAISSHPLTAKLNP